MKKDAQLEILFYIFFRVPSKGVLPPGSIHRAPIDRNAPPPEPHSAILQNPQYISSLQVAQLKSTPGFPVRPPWKEVLISRAFFYTPRFP
jgi:hypothetical protein